MISWGNILQIIEEKRNVRCQCKGDRECMCDVDALKVKVRLARLRGVRHLDAFLPANIEGSSEFGKVILSVLF